MAGVMGFKTVDEVKQWDRESVEKVQSSPLIIGLADRIRSAWTQNRDAKIDVERRMIANKRAVLGEYDPQTLAGIREKDGSDVYIKITTVKCSAAKSWLKDILLSPGERPWGIDPTPVATLKPEEENAIVQKMMAEYQGLLQQGMTIENPEVAQRMQEISELLKEEEIERISQAARDDAKEIETFVDDILKEGGWYEALRDFIDDVVDMPAGFIEGPVVRKKQCLEWVDGPDGSTPNVVSKPVREYSRISPFDVYPAPGAKSLSEGDLIIRKRLERKDLYAMIGVEGYDEDSIRAVLTQYSEGYTEWLAFDSERAEASGTKETSKNEMGLIDTLKFFGSVQGKHLKEWGMSDEEITDLEAEYEVVAYLIDTKVISAKLNPHPLGGRNIHGTSFKRNNESIWGHGVPDLMEDLQKICNGAARALVENMGFSAAPQVWVDVSRMPAGEDITMQYPRKIWKFTTEDLEKGLPMGFFQPESNAEQLKGVYEYFFKQASEITGIPAYMYGSEKSGGAGSTASGLSMLMGAASKGMKDVAGNIDSNVIVKTIEECWLHIMLFEPEKAKGDIKIIPRASDYLIQKEQLQIRRQEFLATTNNPTDLQITGIEGRSEVLREVAGGLHMQKNKVVPEQSGIQARAEQQKMMQIAQTIADTLGVPIDVILQAAQGVAPQQVNPGGSPMGGQEARVV